MYITHLVHSFICEWTLGLSCFHFSAILKDATMNIHVHIFVWMYIFYSFGYIPISVLVGSYGNSMLNHVRN